MIATFTPPETRLPWLCKVTQERHRTIIVALFSSTHDFLKETLNDGLTLPREFIILSGQPQWIYK